MELPQRMPISDSISQTIPGGSEVLIPKRHPRLSELIFSTLTNTPLEPRYRFALTAAVYESSGIIEYPINKSPFRVE